MMGTEGVAVDDIRKEESNMGTGRKILIVDDNNDLRMVVAKMLSWLGYEVSSADSGENGLGLFCQDQFDIVLSDYEMPGMDGVALASSVKKTSPQTPVVIMTGAGRETVFSRKSSAVDEVISKPFTLAQIDETIQSLAGRVLFA
jgi:CheY-like chemotaxis protein